MTLDDFLQAIVADPHSAATTWAVLADWLEEQGDSRWELVRLLYQREYLSDMQPEERDERVRQLLASGMEPIAPSIINSIGMRLVLIPAGTFLMGSPEPEGLTYEYPQHEVEITRPFSLGAFPVTQEQYQRVMGENPSYFSAAGSGKDFIKGTDTTFFPVETVSWDDAMTFCQALSTLPEEKKAGRIYHLPTEAQWEYACRGGANSFTHFHFGDSLSPNQANFRDSKLERTSPVGSYPANGFGLHDMHGNVYEWCLDGFDEPSFQNNPNEEQHGSDEGDIRGFRGGSWGSVANICRAAGSIRVNRATTIDVLGFRVAFRLD